MIVVEAPKRLERAKALGVPTEEQEQRTLAAWLDAMRVTWCHVPNGGARHAVVAGKLRGAGVKAGVPDILIFDAPPDPNCDWEGPHPTGETCPNNAHGVALELKRRDGGRTSDAQAGWLRALDARGWACIVAHGADAAIEILTKLGYDRRR